MTHPAGVACVATAVSPAGAVSNSNSSVVMVPYQPEETMGWVDLTPHWHKTIKCNMITRARQRLHAPATEWPVPTERLRARGGGPMRPMRCHARRRARAAGLLVGVVGSWLADRLPWAGCLAALGRWIF